MMTVRGTGWAWKMDEVGWLVGWWLFLLAESGFRFWF